MVMEFMMCTSCSGLVSVNPTGICLGCQRGFKNTPQEDSWRKSEERAMLSLTEEKKELLESLKHEEKKPRVQKGRSKKKEAGCYEPVLRHSKRGNRKKND